MKVLAILTAVCFPLLWRGRRLLAGVADRPSDFRDTALERRQFYSAKLASERRPGDKGAYERYSLAQVSGMRDTNTKGSSTPPLQFKGGTSVENNGSSMFGDFNDVIWLRPS